MTDEKTPYTEPLRSPDPLPPPIGAVLAMQTAILGWFLHLALPLAVVAGSEVSGWRVVVVGGHAALSLVTGVAPTDPLVLAGSGMLAAELLLAILTVYGLARWRPGGWLVVGLALGAGAMQAAVITLGGELVDGFTNWLWLWPAAAGLWLAAGWQLRGDRVHGSRTDADR